MAKKSAKKKAAKKKVAKKSPKRKSPKRKAATKRAKKKPAAKKAKKKATAKKAAPKKSKKKAVKKSAKRKKAAKSLGRPKVTGDEKLFLLFKDDHQARSIFDFLRAQTVRELEAFSPHDIVHRLTLPLRQTVDRIRRALAEKNRHLADDKEFALEYKASQKD